MLKSFPTAERAGSAISPAASRRVSHPKAIPAAKSPSAPRHPVERQHGADYNGLRPPDAPTGKCITVKPGLLLARCSRSRPSAVRWLRWKTGARVGPSISISMRRWSGGRTPATRSAHSIKQTSVRVEDLVDPQIQKFLDVPQAIGVAMVRWRGEASYSWIRTNVGLLTSRRSAPSAAAIDCTSRVFPRAKVPDERDQTSLRKRFTEGRAESFRSRLHRGR